MLRRKLAEVERGLELTVDGRAVALEPAGEPRLTHPAGQGGLRTTRLELPLSAPARGARDVVIEDRTFAGRVGWKAVQARPGEGTAVRTDAPATDPTGGLRRYPEDLLESPSDVTRAEFDVRPAPGTSLPPTVRRRRRRRPPRLGRGRCDRRGEDGFAALLEGDRLLVLLLLAAFGWGALHALSPGHGKAMVAAYLVGTRGSTRDALMLGATVTVTHTAGVVALGASRSACRPGFSPSSSTRGSRSRPASWSSASASPCCAAARAAITTTIITITTITTAAACSRSARRPG